MAFVTHFTPVNSVRFYPEQNGLPTNINTVPFAWKAWGDSFQPWQTKKTYLIPAYFDDVCTIMVFTQNNDLMSGTALYPPVLEAWQRNNDTMITTDPGYKGTVVATNVTDTDPITGTLTPLYCTCWSFRWTDIAADLDTNSGDFYFKIRNYGNDGTTNIVYLSEYVRVYNNQPDTVLITAKYNTNKQNVIVDGWNSGYTPTFYHRIEASIRRLEIEGYQQTYLQQDYNQNATYTANWRQFAFKVGHKNGIPEYALERLTYALTSDLVTIDGVYYKRKGEGSSNPTGMWQISRQDPDPLISAECKLVEYANSMGDVFRLTPITVLGMPYDVVGTIRYPFAFNMISMTRPTSVTASTGPMAIYNSTDLNDLITYLNDTFAPANGMMGSFSVMGTDIVYIKALTEEWSAGTGVVTFGRYIAVSTKNPNITHNGFGYQIKRATGASRWKAVIDYGDGTVEYRTSTNTEQRQHRYTDGTNVDAYMFHTGESYTTDDSIGYLNLNYYGDDGYTHNIVAGSTCPNELYHFILSFSDTSNISSVDMSCLQTCATTLTNLWLEGNKVDSFSNNVFDGGARFTGPIVDYIIKQSLTTSGVNAVVNSMVTNCDTTVPAAYNASLDIRQQPAQAPTGSALAQLNTLAGVPTNWTISHD